MEYGGLISISYTNILSHTHNPNDGKTLTKPSFPFPNPCNALDNIQTPPVGSFRVGNFVNQAFSSSSFYLFFILILMWPSNTNDIDTLGLSLLLQTTDDFAPTTKLMSHSSCLYNLVGCHSTLFVPPNVYHLSYSWRGEEKKGCK